MSIVSLEFLFFILIILIAYYIIPQKFRWLVLLVGNLSFWCLCSTWEMLLVAFVPIITTFLLSLLINRLLSNGENLKLINFCRFVGITVDVITLIAFKEIGFFVKNANSFLKIFCDKQMDTTFLNAIVAPLGLSYFILTLIAYLLDSSWQLFEVQKNPFKFLTYILYFPALTSGPIMRYGQMKDKIYAGESVDYKTLCFGAQRILWGFFKKLVIADRLSPFVSAIKGTEYKGFFVFIGVIAYSLQLYMDFSGCMDIVLGVSEMLGINLPENFRTPLYATSLSEYWRRWHITLGEWVRDYIMNPLLKSNWLQGIGKKSKKKLGKKWGKKIPVWIALFFTWFSVGFWHGGAWTFIFGSGLFFYILIVGGQILEPVGRWINAKLHIKTDTIVWITWRRIRTFVLFSASISFSWSSSMKDGIAMWKRAFTCWNPSIFIDGSLLKLGINFKNWIVIIAGFIIVYIVSFIQQKYSVRERIASKNVILRWLIYLFLVIAVIIFGRYGSGYSATEFIYGKF